MSTTTMKTFEAIVVIAVVMCAFEIGSSVVAPYYGVRIGKFSTHFHDVKGDVYAVDDRTIFIKNFHYDGKGPDTFFWAGTSIRPDPSGFIIPNEKGSSRVLPAYDGQDLVLRLPEGRKVKDIRWLAVWCKRFRANFGSLIFPKNLQTPSPAVIGPLEDTKHGVTSGPVVILDTQTFLIPDFSYDGSGKEAFWWISRGSKSNVGGLRLYDENGSDAPLQNYKAKTVVISLPDDHAIYDYNTLSVWSVVDIDDYGHVKIPSELIVPPSPRVLGIRMQNRMNCEVLNDQLGFEARWVVNGEELVVQMAGKIGENEYMALGLSKDDAETKFTSADAMVTWVTKDEQGHAVDYYLQSAEECRDGRGMCPDTDHQGARNSLILMNAAKVNNYTMVTFRRPLKAADVEFDQHVYTDGPQAVLWAVGPLLDKEEIGAPRLRTRGNLLLDFGRDPMWNCPEPDINTLTADPSEMISSQAAPEVICPIDYTFRAQIGPSVSGSQPDRVWYINGLPSPDLTVQKGQTYTFLVEGGVSPPRHHPLYITSSADGGLYRKVLEEEESDEDVFAGIARDPETGSLLPTSEGRLCEWSVSSADEDTFGLQQTLELSCGPGNAGKLIWTPDPNTSDIVYYQSFTERNLGGRIRVVDWCEESTPEYYVQELQRLPAAEIVDDLTQDKSKNSELEREGQGPQKITNHPEAERREHFDPEDLEESSLREKTETPDHSGREDGEDIDRSGEAMKKDSPDLFSVVEENGEENSANDSWLGISEERIMNVQKKYDDDQKGKEENQKKPDYILLKKPYGETKNENLNLSQNAHYQDEGPSIFSLLHDNPERLDVDFADHTATDHQEHDQKQLSPPPTRENPENHPGEKLIRKPQHRPLHLPLPEVAAPKNTNPPPGFSVQLEGGFVPLLLKPSQERESAPQPDINLPPPHLRRPFKPFLFDVNESIPFHGTFKPGVPDFSGFNISHYGQPSTIPSPNHIPENPTLSSAPKPQLIQVPLSPPGGALPPELFQRPQGGFPRPPLFYGPRPLPPSFGAEQQHLYIQLPPKHHRPDFFIPRPENEDLDEGSSQRVQVALQSPNEDKIQNGNLPNETLLPDRKGHQGLLPQKNFPHAPPIQRRPDVVEEEQTGHPPPQKRPSTPHHHQQQHIPNSEVTQSDIHHLPQHIRPPRPHLFQRLPPGGGPIFTDHRPHPPTQRLPPGLGIRRPPFFFQRPMGSGIRHPLLPNLPSDHPFRHPPPDGKEGGRPVNDHPPPSSSETSADDSKHQPSQPQGHIFHQLSENTGENNNGDKKESVILPHHGFFGQPLLIRPDFIQQANGPPNIFQRRPTNAHVQPNIQHPHSIPSPQQFPSGPVGKENNENKDNKKPTFLPPDSKPYLIRHPPPLPSREDVDVDSETVTPQENLSDTSKDATTLKKPPQENTSRDEPKTVSNSESNHEELVKVGSSSHPPLLDENAPGEAYYGQEYDDFFNDPQQNDHGLYQNSSDDFLTNVNPFPSFYSEGQQVNSRPEDDHQQIPDHQPTEHNENSDDKSSAEHQDVNAADGLPYGMRLKFPPADDDSRMKPFFQVPNRPPYIPARRRPQFSSPTTKDPSFFAVTTNRPLSRHPNPYLPTSDSSNGEKDQPNELKYGQKVKITSPVITGPHPGPQSPWPGRKNVLPTDPNTTSAPLRVPPVLPENITLPHVSDRPTQHDNGTDYSILTHVLSLIGGQSEPMDVISPRGST